MVEIKTLLSEILIDCQDLACWWNHRISTALITFVVLIAQSFSFLLKLISLSNGQLLNSPGEGEENAENYPPLPIVLEGQ